MSYGSVDGLESKAQEAHVEDSIKILKMKQQKNANTSGACVDCGDKIPEARLLKIPHASCCIQCQEEREENPNSSITYRNPYIP